MKMKETESRVPTLPEKSRIFS